MTILHAHSDPQFAAHLRSVLADAHAHPHSVDIAVGYFYLSGFTQVADLLATRPGKVRILIGRTDTPTQQEIISGYSASEPPVGYHDNQNRRQETDARNKTLDNVSRNAAAQPQDDASEVGIKRLAQLIVDGKVEVRAYLRERMHAKAYIGYTGMASAPGTAIVGSTNFSRAGFTGNTELNYPVTHAGDIGEIRQWFERLWSESEPVSDRVIDKLNNSWPLATPAPYIIYLKVLYELYGDTLGDEPIALDTQPVELTDYQQDAVDAGLAMLQRHNGCYIADVVGMGKTYVGAEILRRFYTAERDAGDPLIICPASLRQMWERTCTRFGLHDADVLSRGRLTEANFRNDRSLQKMLRNAGTVLIDEAHGFRNNSQRRRVLLSFLKGAKPHKVILLSATPQNMAPIDILRQLELFFDPNDHNLPGVSENLHQYFPQDIGRADPSQVASVLQHVLIRRRRQDIRHNYPSSTLHGEPISFPAVNLSNREYSLNHVYKKAGGIKRIADLLNQYQAARYRPAKYLKEAARALPEYSNIARSNRGNLAGIMTTNLWKRLESSIPAFRSTLAVLIDSNRTFRDHILSGGVSKDEGVADSEEAPPISPPKDEEQDTDELDRDEESITIREQSYRAADFDCREWLEDLEADSRVLNAIADSLKTINADPNGDASDDAKLHEIKSFVKSPGVAGEKLLIFTESKVTANYLFRQLKADNPDVNVDLLMGGDRHSADKVTKFSPQSNDCPDMAASEQTQILVATDVIAEGQNLQDCNRVVSYDLHWNPVTLIQRHGRVDRITSEHEEIYLHNMMPDPAVEGAIGIRGTLGNRVQAFHDLIGLDNVVLENAEQVNPESIYAIYDGEMPEEQDAVTDSLAVAQQANALLNRIRREQPELWQRLQRMPNGLRAAMTADDHPSPGSTITLVVSGDRRQGYATNAVGDVAQLTHGELVRQVECEPDTPSVPLPPDINARVGAAVVALARELSPKPASLGQRRRDNRTARYISQHLRQLRMDDTHDADFLQQIEELRAAFTAELPHSVDERIRGMMRSNITGNDLVSALNAMLPDLPKPDRCDKPIPPMGIPPQIACSMSIIAR